MDPGTAADHVRADKGMTQQSLHDGVGNQGIESVAVPTVIAVGHALDDTLAAALEGILILMEAVAGTEVIPGDIALSRGMGGWGGRLLAPP